MSIFNRRTVADILSGFQAVIDDLKEHARVSEDKRREHSWKTAYHNGQAIMHQSERDRALIVSQRIKDLVSAP